VAVGGPALNIAGSSIVVSLLNLQVLNFSAGTTGIVFSGGSQLTLDGCEIYGLPQNGIDVIAPTALFVVKNSVFRDNGGNGITVSQAAGATLDRVQVLGNQLGVALGTVPHSTITDSVFAGNVSGGIILENTDGSSTQLVLERSVVRGSANGVLLNSVISGSRTMVNAKRNTVSDNAGSGFFLGSNDGAFATVTLDRNVVSGNGTGVLMVGIGTNIAQSPVTNTFTWVDANPGPFLTGFAQQ